MTMPIRVIIKNYFTDLVRGWLTTYPTLLADTVQ